MPSFRGTAPKQTGNSVTIVLKFIPPIGRPNEADTTDYRLVTEHRNSGLSDSLKASGGSVAVDSAAPGKLAGIPCYILRMRLILHDGRTVYIRDYPMVVEGKTCLFTIGGNR